MGVGNKYFAFDKCSVRGCNEKPYSNGLCRTDYFKEYRKARKKAKVVPIEPDLKLPGYFPTDRLRRYLASNGIFPSKGSRVEMVLRNKCETIRWDTADSVACCLGVHPTWIWPDYLDEPPQEMSA